ncbi:class I SAM-dependent methyltransferase (plasmid) [Halarchaeum sp. CBA1220]|uniref:class I SAM-dependent methyltransferase n=1 Tax=Halarchaeum sp. CBA1220 TaxID=1853682 RepID=UPI000F3A9516|nr:class I SAM-dependent methyltransferase [Halarchaeum sp. CBA1220]QLC35491.1 class I SAM-dependent methyltransferase [Halarchaeum sp. CBA1220]
MDQTTFDTENASKLEDAAQRYRYLSREELLWALSPDGDETVADLGSGTGFYTDDVAPYVGHVYGIDVQAEMHDHYHEKGLPANVELVEADVADLPLADDELDGALSTMTYHEFASDDALAELVRVLEPGGRLVIVDWAATGDGEAGPPLKTRFDVDGVVTTLRDAGFRIEFRAARRETFLVVGDLDA